MKFAIEQPQDSHEVSAHPDRDSESLQTKMQPANQFSACLSPETHKNRLLQNTLTKKYVQKLVPEKSRNRFSRGPFFIACFEFPVRIALAFSF